MANKPEPPRPDQSFPDAERLFHRLRGNNIGRDGKATFLAFTLPDMSVNREQHSTAEATRKGYDKADWGVVAFLVADIPPRADWTHIAQIYRLLARHVPEARNFSHSEVRVWRKVEEEFILITARVAEDFEEVDPDRMEHRDTAESLLDPDFHMRWRKHIGLAAKMVLPGETNKDDNGQ
jgi:hypothetical protein